jgi:hypothetical protein
MEFLRDDTRRLDLQQRAAALISRAIACDTSLSAVPEETLARRGAARYFKSGDTLLSTDPYVAQHPTGMAFVGLVDAQSLLGKLLGLVNIPLTEGARLLLGTVVADLTAEGAETPHASIAFDVAGAPVKVGTAGIFSNEALMSLDPVTQAAITQVLVAACAAATDVQLVATLTAGTPAASADPGTLLTAISGGRPSRPVLIGGYDALLSLAAGTVRDLQAIGVTVLPCAAANGKLIALDTPGLLVSDSGVMIDVAKHATLPLTFAGSPAVPTNLWQAGLSAVRVVRYLKFAVRAGAVAFAAVGSPA